jgi:hypothetical protein
LARLRENIGLWPKAGIIAPQSNRELNGFFISSPVGGSPEVAMCKVLRSTHFGLVIVPVLAMILAFPASAQVSSNSEARRPGNSDTQRPGNSETPSPPVILVKIDKSKQEMTVSIEGVEKYVWPVSTGLAGYSTPSGTYTATSMNEIWYSKEWDNAPMPHSIFFRKDGYAIHGTYEAKSLGRPASHGCVRLSRENAATLYALVKKIGLKNTEVVLSGVTPGGEYKMAKSAEPRYGQSRYESDNYYARPQWGGGGYYAQPQWGGGGFLGGTSFGGYYSNGSQGRYRQSPPRGY